MHVNRKKLYSDHRHFFAVRSAPFDTNPATDETSCHTFSTTRTRTQQQTNTPSTQMPAAAARTLGWELVQRRRRRRRSSGVRHHIILAMRAHGPRHRKPAGACSVNTAHRLRGSASVRRCLQAQHRFGRT